MRANKAQFAINHMLFAMLSPNEHKAPRVCGLDLAARDKA
jgi:hypothetical protein